jgi:cyclic beta-1,2-glucan synthetase
VAQQAWRRRAFRALFPHRGRPEPRLWQPLFRQLHNGAIRALLFLAFLPYEALLMLDAIITTLVRLYLTRRQLLQWTTAARTVHLFGDEVHAATTWRMMLPSLLLVAALALGVGIIRPTALPVAAPFFSAWFLASQIAYVISAPILRRVYTPGADTRHLRTLARRTWLFYEQFVGPDDNWLPPDHFQEAPRGVAAQRTSPTNVGMYLLSLLAAHDLGYMTTSDYVLRLRFTFDTLARLERYRGHFLNWIDTHTLAPLPPRYVSTVDSGNLAVHV